MGIRDLLKPAPPVFSTPQPAKASTVRPIVGSGEKINLRDPSNIENLRTRVYTEWQNDAWAYYDAIGEIKYGFGLVGAVMSRVRLYPALAVDKDATPISTSDYLRRSVDQSDDEQSKDIDAELALPERITADVVVYLEELVADLFSGRGGQSSFMRNYALNICVAGECYLIQYKDQWHIKSTSEIVSSVDGKVILRRLRAGGSTSTTAAGGQPGDIELPKGAYVGRIWREHPRYSLEPESSMLGLREVCDELLVLQRMIRATARSRMNAGILYVPTGLSAAGSSVNADTATDEESLDELMSDIYDSIASSIDDETASSTVIPIGVSGPPEAADKLKLINLSRESDQFLVERCDRALERLLQGLDMPKDVVSGMANVKYCVDDQTQALTKTGWKFHTELSTDDEVWTINPTTRLGEWQPIQQMNRFDVVEEAMHRFETRDHSSLTTDDHRWMLTDGTFINSKNYKGGYVPQAAMAASFPELPKYSDDLVELVAWVYTEGSYGALTEKVKGRANGIYRRRWLSIAQSESANPQHVERIRQTLTRVYGPESRADNTRVAASKSSFTHGQPKWRQNRDFEFLLNEEAAQPIIEILGEDKTPSYDFLLSLTKAQLELFVQVSSWADGCGREVAGSVFGQKHEPRQEAFEFACHLLGYAISRRSNGTNGWYDCRVKTRSACALRGRPDRNPESHRIEKYTGVVWCPTTANSTWFARRDGKYYFTGNSNALQIDESLYKGHIEPLALMLVDALTTMYIHPALKKRFKDLTSRDLDFLRVWYDPSEVTTKSDPAQSANTGYDNFAISAAAWRAAHGFSDTDAPTEHELAQRYLFLKGAPQPEQLGVLMKEAFPTITDKQRAANLANSPVPMPESAQEMLYGEVVAPVDATTRDGQNPAVTATESATAVDPNNPTGATGTF